MVELTISSFSVNGKGVATMDLGGFKRPVFIPGAIPGDIVEVEILSSNKKYYEAELDEILEPSPHRIQPPCPHFGTCGACDWLNVDYEFQLESKKKILQFLFSRKKIYHPEISIIGDSSPLNYRQKIRLPFKNGSFGYYKNKSKEIVPITSCSIIDKKFNDFVFSQKHDLKDGEYTYIIDQEKQVVLEKGFASYSFEDINFIFTPRSFIQSNLHQNIELLKTVRDLFPGGSLLDLYSGIGNFSLPLAKKATKVVSVEGNPSAHAFALQNIQKNNFKNVQAINSDVKSFIHQMNDSFDTILLDPPRIGANEVLEKISQKTKNIIYVSCGPEALMNDSQLLIKQGFKIEKVVIVDMFPQTHHFESVLLFRKN